MTSGKAIVPVYGNSANDHGRGNCMYPVGGALCSVTKCPECGYSVGPRVHGFTDSGVVYAR